MTSWRRGWWRAALVLLVYLVLHQLPEEGSAEFSGLPGPIVEALLLARDYARDHVLTCLVPAFFISGAISVFVSQGAVMRFLGAGARRSTAYAVASISGTVLAVCSCTVLPLFSGIYRMGAGLGPASTFLYSGPAINVLAIVLTARVLGPGLGAARAVGAVLFSILIGLAMHLLFRRSGTAQAGRTAAAMPDSPPRPLWRTSLLFICMVVVLVFANLGERVGYAGCCESPLMSGVEDDAGGGLLARVWDSLRTARWIVVAVAAASLGMMMSVWMGVAWWKLLAAAAVTTAAALCLPGAPPAFAAGVVGLTWAAASTRGEAREWCGQTWGFALQIMPLLFAGVAVSGLLLGRPGHEGLIPSGWIASAVGGNTLAANFSASFAGALMYFATLTEVPILQGLIGSGMGDGPALALLLAGPALSLPSMLVIGSVLGARRTLVFIALVVALSTAAGMLYGAVAG